MSFATTVFLIEDFLKAAKANPQDYIKFEVEIPPEGHTWKATHFKMSARMNTNDKFVDCLFYARALRVVRAPYELATSKIKAENDNVTNFEVSGNHSGMYREFIDLINAERDRAIKALKGTKGVSPKIDQEKFLPMYNDMYSDKANKAVANTNFKDPVDRSKDDVRIKLSVDLSKWAGEKIPANLKGQNKSMIYNFLTGKLNETTGQIDYEAMTVDAAEVSKHNVHNAIPNGTIVEELYVSLKSTTQSQLGVTTKQLVTRMVITPAERREFVVVNKENSDLLAKIREKQAAAAATAAAAAQTPTAPALPMTTTAPTIDDLARVVDKALGTTDAINNI